MQQQLGVVYLLNCRRLTGLYLPGGAGEHGGRPRSRRGCALDKEAKAAAAAKDAAKEEGYAKATHQEGLMICSCCYRLDRCSSSGEDGGTPTGGAAAAAAATTTRGGWDP